MPNAKSLVLVFALLLMSNVLLGYQLYVDAAANPQTADGSSAHPYIAIQDAIDHAFDDNLQENEYGPAVVINVASHSQGYQEELSIVYYTSNANLHNVQDITIKSRSNNPEYCVLRIPENSEYGVQVSGATQSKLKIQGIGFEMYPNGDTYNGILLLQDPETSNAPEFAMDELHIDNCVFNDFPVAIDAYLVSFMDRFIVSNSVFQDTGTTQFNKCFAIYSTNMSNHASVTGNTISIDIAYSLDPVTNAYLAIGRFHNIEFNDNTIVNAASSINSSHYLEAQNNTFTNSPIEIGGEIELDCKNNSFISDSELSYRALTIAKDTSEALAISYNQFYNCTTCIYFDQYDGVWCFRDLNNHIYKNTFIDCEKILNIRLGWVPYNYPPISVFRDNLYFGSHTDLFTITDEYYVPYELTGDSRIPVSYSHFSAGLTNTGSLNLDTASISYGDPYIEVDSQAHTYELLWDYYVKSPCINSGCSVINGEIQTDPDGTPPDIGAIYYPHHHRVYFDSFSPSNIYWLSFPVLDDRTNTDGVYWNELGFMFASNMIIPDPLLEQIRWSYDGESPIMDYHEDMLYWNNSSNRVAQPKGYKVQFARGIHPTPVLINGFRANPRTTPVSWVVSVNVNGQMQPFENWVGYFGDIGMSSRTVRAGDALSGYLPGSHRFKYLDYVHTIKTRTWGTCRISEEFGSPWIVDPNTYTFSDGDMVALTLLPDAPQEMYWKARLDSAQPTERPVPTAFVYEEKLDYTPVFLEFDPQNMPEEVGLYVNGVCQGAAVVDSTIMDICLYRDDAKNAGELEIVFYQEGKGMKAAQSWKVYNAESMVFEDATLNTNEIDRYAYISFLHKTGDSPVPLVTRMQPNYPNPFNPSTNISFVLASDMSVRLEIYNVRGQKVKTLCNSELTKGKHTLEWNGKDDQDRQVASGIYFSRLNSPEGNFVHKMMLMK